MAVVENQLVARLPRQDRLRLISLCTPVEIFLGDVLGEPGDPTRNVYFPIDGFISLVTLLDGHQSLEVGMVGREGMVGVELAFGFSRSPVRMLVQGSGTAWRLGAAALRSQMEGSAALRRVIQSYIFALMLQLTTTAACLRFHLIGARLARWLLMTQDRAQSEHFDVTHEFLSFMLGARRVGVTKAAIVLQRQGLILYRRGHLTVLDRAGLEAAACSCYATDLGSYAASFPVKLRKLVPSIR